MIENNINQITKHMNTFKFISESQSKEYLNLLQEFWGIRKK